MIRRRVWLAVAGLVMAGFTISAFARLHLPNLLPFLDPSGIFRTFNLRPVDLSNPFFNRLGTNDRTCASCHDAGDGWSITPAHLQQRFQISRGRDPVFRAIDGANCPSADVSTVEARSSAYSLLLNKGLIRMTLPVPANAEFSIISVNDPYQCPETTANQPALYRRPDSELRQIVSLETSLLTAQSADNVAGNLGSQGARGGPVFLSMQRFYPGINSGAEFTPNGFTLYPKWASASGPNAAAQQSIARGEMLFNNRPMIISVVPGFNDVQGNSQAVGTCTTCHNAPNVGGNSLFAMMNIGTGSPKADLPSYLILCNDSTQVTTTDPGRAMVTGKCADIGKFKVPGLRGLPARAPYFHNGTAATLLDVVNFYDQRFNMLLTDDEKVDLVAFMNTL